MSRHNEKKSTIPHYKKGTNEKTTAACPARKPEIQDASPFDNFSAPDSREQEKMTDDGRKKRKHSQTQPHAFLPAN